LFHIAIAIVAISVVAKRKEFWYLSMVVSTIGVIFFAKAVLTAPAPFKGEEPTPAAKHGQHETSTTGTKDSGDHATEKLSSAAPKSTAE
jgi:hypothetical protein